MTQSIEPISIDGITFDALIDADETWASDVPAYPTEEGFEVSDTIIIRPLTLNLSVFLTNTPVTWKAIHDEGTYRVQDVIKRLRYLYFKKTPVIVKTNEQDYENMAIVSISLPKKVETGTSRLIPISLQQIMVTELQTTEIPASYGRGGATGVNAGTAQVSTFTPPRASANSAGGAGIPSSVDALTSLLGGNGPLALNIAQGIGFFND